jgi:hypothetical protein
MDNPTVMSVLEFCTQVGLWDGRRETAIQPSKKERKKHLFIARQSRSVEVMLLMRQAAQLCHGFPQSLTLEHLRGRLKGLGGH